MSFSESLTHQSRLSVMNIRMQRLVLFKPYSSDEAQSCALVYPLEFLFNVIANGIVAPLAGAGLLLFGMSQGNRDNIKDGFLSICLGIVNAVLDIVNALLSALTFTTRTLCTLYRGYDIQSKISDDELEAGVWANSICRCPLFN